MGEGRSIGRWIVFTLLLLAAATAAVHREAFDESTVRNSVAELGDLAPLAFIAVYVVAALLFLPGSLMTLAGGALFGPVLGTAYSLVGATLGATISFLVARYVAGEWVARKAVGRLKGLMEGVESAGWRFVAFVRLVPVFPYNLLNYGLGLTRMRLSHYVIATLAGMLPGAAAYSYLGHAAHEAAAGHEGSVQQVLLAIGLVTGLALLLPLVRGRRRSRRGGE